MTFNESIVRNGYLSSPDYPAPLTVPSSEWQSWLERNVKFRYEGAASSFSAFKDKRGYWVAQKRTNGKLRQKRLGNSRTLGKMTQTQLVDIAQSLCASDYDYQKRDRDPDYLKHRITQLEAEVNKWKDELYKAKQTYENAEMKLWESHSKTDSDRDERLNEAITILKSALKLKANAGGSIKNEIKIALKLLQTD